MYFLLSRNKKYQITVQEKEAYCVHINKCLMGDPHASRHLPLDAEGNDLFMKMEDGLILCKLINLAQSGSIDERSLNVQEGMTMYHKIENVTLALNSAKAIGCRAVGAVSDIRTSRYSIITQKYLLCTFYLLFRLPE